MTIFLIIEKSVDSLIWGRVEYQDNLLVDSAKNLETLERKFRRLLHDFHGIDPTKIKFEIAYDLSSVFQYKNFLNITAVAARAGINASLMRQYAVGIKHPSKEIVTKIEHTIKDLGRDLIATKIAAKSGLKNSEKKKSKREPA